MLKEAVQASFRDPAAQHRGIAFWALNGDLRSAELRRQIDFFKTMGLGAVCLHARSGLETRYLSPQWFKLMRDCVEHCKKQGMLVWLYDEDRYPSGAAGGLVTRNPRYRQKRLRFEFLPRDNPAPPADTIAIFALSGSERKPGSYRRIANPSDRRSSERLAVFRTLDAPLNPWYNGYTYLDAMNPQAVRRFIESTYEPYRRELGRHFGTTIEAMFTDEPCYGQSLISFWGDFIDGYKDAELREVPWSHQLQQIFRKRYGYDLLDRLPELYFDFNGQTGSTRHDFYNLLTTQLAHSFAEQIGDWCEQAGLQFAGHVLFEETCSTQTSSVGSAMRFYEHFQIPGIDILTDSCPDYDTAIQCASVARQMGSRWVLSETYGVTGWDFPLEGHKAVGDWQAALGVNRRCLHLSFYTMRGAAKRDCPASISFQSAWAPHYKPVEDYFGRLSALLSRGRARCPLLVIHPVESTWLRWRLHAKDRSDIKAMDQRLIALRNWLLQEQVGFDYGEEQVLMERGCVVSGKPTPQVQVGQSRYDAVLVPPMLTIRSSTLTLLERYADAGGRVIFAGPVAGLVDAQPSHRLRKLARRCERAAFTHAAVSARVSKLASIRVAPADANRHVLSQIRDDGRHTTVFICNTNRKRGISNLQVDIAADGFVEEWDALTARHFAVPAKRLTNGVRLTTSLPSSGSRLFIVKPTKRTLQSRPVFHDVRRMVLPAEGWDPILREPNPLVLDFVRVRIGQGEWSDQMEVLKADRMLRERIGYKPHSYFEVQPWKRPSHNGRAHRVTVESSFSVETIPAGSIFVTFEHIDGLRRAQLNGFEIDLSKNDGHWVDPCFQKYQVSPQWLRRGENRLSFAVDYVERTGLEASYLLSGGAVKAAPGNSLLKSALQSIRIGDIGKQGLPFYGASLIYSRTIQIKRRAGEQIVLSLPKWRGACVLVHLDGRQVGAIYWPPDELTLPISDNHPHQLGIEVILGRGNTFGPLHRRGKISPWVGPFEWETTGPKWQDAYRLSPNGLLQSPELVFRREKA